jgi:hypothetical protein
MLKNILKPHLKQQWVIPPSANAAFMEAVLEVYTRPRYPGRPLVCLDETSKQLIRETRVPLPMKHDQPSVSSRRAVRVALHAEARQLAEHGGV